jgi:hypothetical protein
MRALEKAARQAELFMLHTYIPKTKRKKSPSFGETVAIGIQKPMSNNTLPNRQHKPTVDAHAKLDSIEFGICPLIVLG